MMSHIIQQNMKENQLRNALELIKSEIIAEFIVNSNTHSRSPQDQIVRCTRELNTKFNDILRDVYNDGKMTKRDFWLKLFSESDSALACAIHLCERFGSDDISDEGKEFIRQRREELNHIMSQEAIDEVFGERK